MNELDLVNNINNAIVSDDYRKIVDILNNLLNYKVNHKKNLDLIYMIISSTQLYGFLSYLTSDEIDAFFKSDYFRAASYSGIMINLYNSGQLSFLKNLEKNKKVFFSAATSFGKTSLLIEYIITHYKVLKNITFVVPTNSLLEELYIKFSKINKDLHLGYNVTTQINSDKSKSISFLTPEKFLILVESGGLIKQDLIVMDEAYKILDFKKGKVSDFINNRSLRFRKVADIIARMDTKVVFLSPFTYKLSDSMKRFLDIHSIKKIDRDLEYVTRELVLLSGSNEYSNYFKEKVVGYRVNLSVPKKCSFIIPKLKNEKNIVYVSTYATAYDIVDELDLEIDLSNGSDALKSRFNKFLKHLQDKFNVDDMPEWKVITALKKGVAIYFSPIPRYIKKEIIYLFENDVIHTLIVTNSFTEGVNTNAKNLIFTSLFTAGAVNLSNIDILNVAGRAGRFAQNPIGRIICLKKDVYEKMIELKENNNIILENYNYIDNQNSLIDYEYEMIKDEFLLDIYISKKNKTKRELFDLGLTEQEINISLNVSNDWKIYLYKKLKEEDDEELVNIYNSFKNLIYADEYEKSKPLNYLFNKLNNLFIDFDNNIFSYTYGEIPAFSKKNNFTWGALYKIYTQGSNKKIIKTNLNYVRKKFNEVIGHLDYNIDKKYIPYSFEEYGYKWILDKYYDKDLNIIYNKFYTETFKFISNIIQYKIPFYLSFFISIFGLFIKKEKKGLIPDIEDVNSRSLVSYFEDGVISSEYNSLIDYGLPNELVNNLKNKQIGVSKILLREYNGDMFDEYENLILDEFIKLNVD